MEPAYGHFAFVPDQPRPYWERRNSPPIPWPDDSARTTGTRPGRCRVGWDEPSRALERVSQGFHRPQTITDPGAAIETMQRAWFDRRPIVVELAVDSQVLLDRETCSDRSTT